MDAVLVDPLVAIAFGQDETEFARKLFELTRILLMRNHKAAVIKKQRCVGCG